MNNVVIIMIKINYNNKLHLQDKTRLLNTAV